MQNKDGLTALNLVTQGNCDQRVIPLLKKAEREWRKKHKESPSYVDQVANGKQLQSPQK